MKTQHRWRWFTSLVVAFVLVIGMAQPAQASAPVLLYGSQWLNGQGVNVCDGSTDPYCGGELHVGGWSANWWQCVELAQRLYQKMGWHGGIFSGVNYAYQIYDLAGNLGMTRQANGSISSIVPGDMIIHGSDTPYSGGAGHVSIVDRVEGSSVYAVEQNTYNDQPRASYTWSGGTISRPGTGTLRGVVHDPGNHLNSDSIPNRVMLINASSGIYAKDSLDIGGWLDQATTSSKVTVGGGRMALINTANQVYAKDHLGAGGWLDQNAQAKQIAVGHTGRMI
ncbi:MAG TPA: CHAP domain-containing protein, partial [Candidatus Saccharimonadales bacterium]|nr:CHAP domain-containing protein [Candidatus Saccharimonadales bacterium]